MRHLHAGRNLGVDPSQRIALLRSLTLALIEHETIRTTPARAKELRWYAERVVTLAKRVNLSGRRHIIKILGSTQTNKTGENRVRNAIERVYTNLVPRFKTRPGGYTQILRLVDRRPGDNAEMCLIRYMPAPDEKERKRGKGQEGIWREKDGVGPLPKRSPKKRPPTNPLKTKRPRLRRRRIRNRRLASGKSSATALGILLLTSIALLLVFGEPYFRSQKGTFNLTSKQVPSKMPLDKTLAWLSPQKGETLVTLATLARQKKSGILVNFWATWCPPCVEELPSLEMLARELRGHGSENLPSLIAVSVDEAPAEVYTFFKTLGFEPTLSVLHDRDAALSRSVGTFRLPETYWIDENGNILYKWIGPQNWLSPNVLNLLRQGQG